MIRNRSKTSTRPHTSYPNTDAPFKSTKEDKRRMKHSALMSRIEKSSPKVQKRRRPSRKLVTNLEDLADALPDTLFTKQTKTSIDNIRVRHKSLKSRPGAMKKKGQLERMERERFQMNMAQMATVNSDSIDFVTNDGDKPGSAANLSSERWAALRGYISSTMDRDVMDKAS